MAISCGLVKRSLLLVVGSAEYVDFGPTIDQQPGHRCMASIAGLVKSGVAFFQSMHLIFFSRYSFLGCSIGKRTRLHYRRRRPLSRCRVVSAQSACSLLLRLGVGTSLPCHSSATVSSGDAPPSSIEDSTPTREKEMRTQTPARNLEL